MTCRTFTLVFLFASLMVALACSSDDPAEPEVTDPTYIWAGNGRAGFGATGYLPRKTRLYWPQDVTFTPDARPMVIDWNNHRVLAVDVEGNFTLVVGADSLSPDIGDPCPAPPADCFDIVATGAKLNHPTHVAYDANGNMVLCAWHNSELFLLDTATGLMDRFIGTGFRPCFGPNQQDPQDALSACVDLPASVAFDPEGGLCFTDQANMIIRRVDMGTGIVTTIAGTQPTPNPAFPATSSDKWIIHFDFTGDGGPATAATLSFERGQIADPGGKICFDTFGNMFIADTWNHAVRRIDHVTGIITRFAGAAPVYDDSLKIYVGVPGYSGDGGAATSAKLFEPRDVAVDFDGTVYIADTANNVIRKVSPGGSISTVMGVHRKKNPSALMPDQVIAEDGASAKAVHLTQPSGVAVDVSGLLYVADTGNNVIRIFDR